jgi:hypothetical protein
MRNTGEYDSCGVHRALSPFEKRMSYGSRSMIAYFVPSEAQPFSSRHGHYTSFIKKRRCRYPRNRNCFRVINCRLVACKRIGYKNGKPQHLFGDFCAKQNAHCVSSDEETNLRRRNLPTKLAGRAGQIAQRGKHAFIEHI